MSAKCQKRTLRLSLRAVFKRAGRANSVRKFSRHGRRKEEVAAAYTRFTFEDLCDSKRSRSYLDSGPPRAIAKRSQKVLSTFIRAYRLSLPSTRVQGATDVLVY